MAEAKLKPDGSKYFKLEGGPYHGYVLRLYPQNDGWSEFVLKGHRYVPTGEETRKHAKMGYVGCGENP